MPLSDASEVPKPAASPYLCALGMAYLLAPEGAIEEDNLRALFLRRATTERIDGDALLAVQSVNLRGAGLEEAMVSW